MAGETPALLYRPALLCLRSFIKMHPGQDKYMAPPCFVGEGEKGGKGGKGGTGGRAAEFWGGSCPCYPCSKTAFVG